MNEPFSDDEMINWNTERRLLPYPNSQYDDDDDDDFDVTTKELTLEFRRRVEEMQAEKHRAQRIVETEIKAAVEERDMVLGKCRVMREEMERMKRKNAEHVRTSPRGSVFEVRMKMYL